MKTMKLQYLGLPISVGLVALSVIEFGLTFKLAILLPLAIASGPLLIIDSITQRLPNKITYPAIATTLTLIFLRALTSWSMDEFFWALTKASAFFLIFFFLYLITRGGIGAGDAKLALLIGLSLSPFPARYLALSLIISFVLSALYSIVKLVQREVSLQSKIAFGPFLIVAPWICIFLRPSIL